jgi:hypothetical protein
MKTCPYCSEKIQDGSIKYQYWREWLDGRAYPVSANFVPFSHAHYYNYEYKLVAQRFGLPLIHIARGYDLQAIRPHVAKGIVGIAKTLHRVPHS